MTPGAIAVAGAGNPSNCLMTMADLSIGNMTMTLNGCGAGIGGNLAGTNPNAVINGVPAPSVGVTGTCSGTCGAMGSLTTGAPTPTNPFNGLPLPTDPGGCTAGLGPILSGGCYSSIADTVTTLNAGIYYVTGPLNIDNLTGTNVMIFLTGAGQLKASSSKPTINLTAPTTGPYKGIAIFQDPANTNDVDFKNSFTFDVSGAIYMPGAAVDVKNGLTFTARNCTLFVAKSLTVKNGNGTLNSSGCAGAFGGAVFLSASIAQ